MARLTFEQIVSPLLLRRFQDEAMVEEGDGRHYALILRDNGDLVAHHPGSPALDPMQSLWAADVLKGLNRELHHDGAWVIVFTHVLPARDLRAIDAPAHWNYGRYAIIWIDADGDPQFTMEWIAGENSGFMTFADVVAAGIESTFQKAAYSWATWYELMVKLIDASEGQTFKKAKGEKAPSQPH